MANIKELQPDSSPQAAFGARVRRLREARSWNQEDLAAALDYSSQHVSAVETGRKPPTRRLSRQLDVAFDLTDTADSFEREWTELRRGSLLEGFPEYAEAESRAVEIRVFETGVVPGLLQTLEYAWVLANSAVARGAITEAQAEERVTFLAERQAALVRDRPPMLFVAMDESCLRRPIGGSAVMDAQLARLVEIAAAPNVLLQVAPFALGERRTLNLPVNLLTMSDRSVMAYAESQAQGHLDRESSSVLPILTAYHQLQRAALSTAETVAMIEHMRKGTP
ncbi:helix-turn-helix domain-containing protein [Actinacidiphila alni]|uniref:helix-turn-helix domain-containing protein n=1 Tax=Actinacidiphila alni TaxID=380248 RepID=UPI003451E1E8